MTDKHDYNPLVSIVIPTYNRAEYIRETIQSVISQNYRPLELVIVDDASTDSTMSIIDELRLPLLKENIKLVLIQNSHNQGCGAALNNGFMIAKGEFISYLGSDDLLVDPDKTNRQVLVMAHHNADWSYFSDSMIGTELSRAKLFQPTYIPRFRYLNSFIARRPRLRLLFLLWRNPINSSSFMVRRIVYLEHGGWQPWTKNADCDGLLLMTYSYLGLKCIDIDGAPIFYRVHEGQVSLDKKSMETGKSKTKGHIMNLLETQNESFIYRKLAKLFRWLG